MGEALSPAVQGLRSVPAEAIATAVVGGTASVLAGGKFANGAVTASFGFAFNQLAHTWSAEELCQDTCSASPHLIDALKRGEDFSSTLYNDATGNATIGYGHLVHRGKINGSESSNFAHGITEAEADLLLYADLVPAVSDVNRLVTIPLKQNQFDALVMFRFNVGVGGFARSTALSEINNGNLMGGAMSMYMFNKGTINGQRVFIKGLINRRMAEYDMFVNGRY